MQDFLQGNNLTSNRQYILYLKDFFCWLYCVHTRHTGVKRFFLSNVFERVSTFLLAVFCLFNILAIICLLKNVNTPTLKVHVPLTI